ncbi:MAG TPA: maltodextrin glucosidase [Kofleriaceae bacterium]|nr:maltodextrin glucosidase [Kofleriaceae bacterium]
MRLLHPPVAPWLIRGPEGCRITLLCTGVAPRAIYLRADPDNEELLIAMHAAGSLHGLARFEAMLPWDRGNDTTHYAFKVLHDHRQTWLAADGTHAHPPPRELLFKVCRDHQPPPWVADQIVYQIFPDRFCQGDPSHAVTTEEYVYGVGRSRVVREPWGAPIDRTRPATAFYGGDLPGIRQRLDYLQGELGVTTLYLNPIFTSGSNHKYDTEDYDHVDRHLGGNTALAELSADLHGRGMRLILDAVVNHTGANHPWFNRFGRHDTVGAYQSEASRWRSWYLFTGPHEYVSWKGHASLPVLDFADPEVRAAVYAAPDAILRRWMRPPYSIDGWRFDVIHMLGEGPGARNNAHHARELRRALREENREAYVLGEHFAEATRWLQGDQEDGAMNYYGFTFPVRAWLAGEDVAGHPAELSTPELERWLTAARARLPYENQLAQLNLIDSHDTSRLLTAVGGDLARMQLAVTLLFTYPGVPCIYYGDEIGLQGAGDPDCRRCFDWDRAHWNMALHDQYRRLSAWRHQRTEWRRGAYQTVAVGPDALVFARYLERDITLVAVNRGDAPAELSLPLEGLPVQPPRWRDASDRAVTLTGSLHVPARGTVLLFGDPG